MAGVGVGVEIPLLPLLAGGVGVDVLQLPGDGAGPAPLHVLPGRADGVDDGVGLGRSSQQDGRLGQGQLGLREPQLHGRVHAGLDDGHRLGIGQPHVLAGGAEQAAAGGNQIPRLQESGQIVEGRVRITAPEGFHQGGGHVVHGVSPPVIPHGAALAHLPGVRQGERQRSVLDGGGLVEQLHRVHSLAHVPAAGLGHVVRHPLLPAQGQGALRTDQVQGPVHGGAHVGGGDGLELKDRAAAEEGGVDVEVGVLGGGGDEGDGPVLHKLQQGLLLLLVEVLDLVQVQQHAPRGHQRAHLSDDVLDILERGGGGVEPVEGAVGLPGNDVGNGGLAGAGGAVEDHVGVRPFLDEPAQQGVGAQQMPLAHHLLQGLGTDTVRQGAVHRRSLPFQDRALSPVRTSPRQWPAPPSARTGRCPGPARLKHRCPSTGTAPCQWTPPLPDWD